MASSPALYVRGRESAPVRRDFLIARAQEEPGWPEPVVYADAGEYDEPRPALAALAEAIAAGRHDGVFAASPSRLGNDLDQVQAFDRLCRQHGVPLRFSWYREVTDTRGLFDIVQMATDFTVTEDHLRLLRRSYVSWDDAEFGAPEIHARRPYGHSTVLRDIAEILEVPESEWSQGDQVPTFDAEWRFLRLHVETAIALQIALLTGEFRTGRYVRDDEYEHRSWRPFDA